MIPETLRKMNSFSSSNKPAVLGPGGTNQIPYYNGGWAYVDGAGITYKGRFINTIINGNNLLSAFEPLTVLTNQIAHFYFYPDPVNYPSTYIDKLYSDNSKSALKLPVHFFYDMSLMDRNGNSSSKTTNFILNTVYNGTVIFFIDEPHVLQDIGVVHKAFIHNNTADGTKIYFFMPDEWCNANYSNTSYPLQILGGVQVSGVSVNRQLTTAVLENDYTYISFDIYPHKGIEVEYYWIFENIPLLADSVLLDKNTDYGANFDKLYNLKLVVRITDGFETKYAS